MKINGFNVEFDETKHEYTVDGVKVPSVTEICSYITGEHYGAINPAVLEYASRRGTAIHEATEVIDYDGEPELDAEIAPYVQAYVDFLSDYRPEWEMIEQVVYNPIYGYCGTIDRYGKVGKEWWVLDIKSTASPNREQYMSVCCQTSAYLMAIAPYTEQGMIAQRKALYLRKDGTYRLVDLTEWEVKNGLHAEQLFSRMAKLKRDIERIKHNGKKRNLKGSDAD